MPVLFGFLLRALLLMVGLVVATGMLAVFGLVLAWWSLRALWARLTGRPIAPLGARMGAAQAFQDMMRRGPPRANSRTPRADAAGGPGPGRGADDVTDVQPRPPT
jgi:hypothetical protein